MIIPEPAPSHQDTAADAVAVRWAQRATGASIVDPVRLRAPGASVAAYRDNRWPLEALGNQCTEAIVFAQQRRRKAASMGWRDVEPEWRDLLKRVAWLMINQPVPDHLLLLPGSNYTARPGAGTILFTVLRLITFLRWLRAGATNTDVTEIQHRPAPPPAVGQAHPRPQTFGCSRTSSSPRAKAVRLASTLCLQRLDPSREEVSS